MAAAPPSGIWWRDDAAVALALAVLAFALAAGEWLWRADRVVYDAGLALWSRPAPADVVIVAIDDASIDAIGRWPWKRSIHATLLERVAAARPRAVALDLVLSEPDPDPRQDELLAAAAAHAAPVVMPVAWQQLPSAALRLLEPVPPIRSVVVLGAAEQPVDDDGVLRHAFLEAGPAGRNLPHLALALLRAGGAQPPAGMAVERIGEGANEHGWRRQGKFLIRYGGPPGHVARVSYVDVLRGAVPAERLSGRFVLIGMTALGMGDTLATPVNASQRAMPGVEVLAHTLQTLRTGEAIRPLSPLASGSLAAVGVLVLVAGFGLAGTRLALLLALASVPLALGASLAALWAGAWWGPAAYVAAAALAYPLWSWRRLERGVDLLDKEIGRLAGEPGLLLPRVSASAAAGRRDRLAERLASLHVAADTLRSARRFLADALAGLPAALLVDDGAGRVLLANPPAARLFEVESADELQSLDLARLLGEFECNPAIDWAAALQPVRSQRSTLVAQARLAGQSHLIHAHGVPMHGGTRLIVAVADISPIKKAEREREEMLAFVSHDLRAPATSIALLVDAALAGQAIVAGDDLLREVRRLAGRTQALADDFVRVLHAEQRTLQPQTVELAVLAREAAADFAAQADAAAVTLQLGEASSPAGSLQLDRALVLRAVGNLLSNAIKHSPRGGIVALTWRGDPHGQRGAFEVSDQGAGLSTSAMRRLMEAPDGLLPTSAGGVGFGLLLVQRVAQRHHGRLEVHAGDGGGSRFTLELESLPAQPR